MTKQKKNQISRWVTIATISMLALLLLGGAIYAQAGPGFGRGQGPGDGRGMQQGPGMGQGMGQGMGPGGPQDMHGMQFLMQDPEIMNLVAQIRIIEGINKLELTYEQVEEFLGLAIEAQGIIDDECNEARNELRGALEDHLQAALTDPGHEDGFMQRIMEEHRDRDEPGAIREQMEVILDRAAGILTDEQIEHMMDQHRPGFHARAENWQNQDGRGQQWFRGLNDDERNRVENQFRGRIDGMAGGAVRMRVMMFLMSPQAVEAMELWLDAN